ncbi:RNA recognition motif-containing protein [Neopestalotiopsis sp. 37M]|nr:RNA recognition motif-containing protein [Neopestalotiopsis sp. 37M]
MAGHTKKRSRDDPEETTVTAASASAGSSQIQNAAAQTEPSSKRARVEAGRSLFVRSLPPSATDETLTDFFSEHFPVKSAVVVKDPTTKQSRGYGFVVLTDAQDATDAKAKLHGQKFDGRPINIEVAKHRDRKSATVDADKEERRNAEKEARKPPKLIIRNLPWSIKKPDQLAALFRGYGKIYYCDLPQSKGKLSGFGFVTMKRKGAEKAIEAVNGKIVDGRTLAVDWAVSKQEWGSLQQQEGQQSKADLTGKDAEEKSGEGKKPSADPQGKKKAEDEDEDEEEDEDLRNFMKNFGDKLEDEDSEADGEDDEDLEDQDDDEIDDPAEDLDDEQDKKPTKSLMTDNSSTLFIRNLPFSTTDADLKSHFEQFGRVRYARVVMDRATDRPAGTGFVNFLSNDDAKACLKGAPRPRAPDASGKRSILQDELADAQGSYTLEGRVLQISQAVSKDEATKLTADGIATRDGKDRDKRRLYLLSEGTITPSSPLFALLAPSEVKMREESAAQRKKQIQGNPSLHLSLTRLAVRNIPRNMDHKEVKALAREAVVGFSKDVKEGLREPLSKEEMARGGEEDREAERKRKEKGKGIVKQAKVVYENKQGSKVAEGDGAGKSRGYGFIEYSSHRWALMGLRWLNGHALKNDAGKTQRLIVEFAIENAQVVSRRNERQTKQGRTDTNANEVEQSKTREGQQQSSRFGRNDRGPAAKGKHLAQKFKGTGDKTVDQSGIESKKSDTRSALEQKIIGRKRIMKKKKAGARR